MSLMVNSVNHSELQRCEYNKTATLIFGYPCQDVYKSLSQLNKRIVELIRFFVLIIFGSIIHYIVKKLTYQRVSPPLEQHWTKVAKTVAVTGLIAMCCFWFAKIKFSGTTQEPEINEVDNSINTRRICKPIVNASDFDFENPKDCTKEEIRQARVEHDRLREEALAKEKAIEEEHDRQIKEDAIEYAEEKMRPYRERWEKERSEWEEWNRRMYNPSPEEEDRLARLEKMDQELSQRLPGYIPQAWAQKPKRPECPSIENLSNPEKYKQRSLQDLAEDTNISPYCREHAEIILGVTSGADQKEIKRQYRRLSQLHHPDKDHSVESKVFTLIATAYETLNPKEDESLRTPSY